LQEELEQRTVAITIKAAKLSDRLLAKAMAATLRQMQKSHNKAKPGQQSIKRLNRTVGGETDNIEVMGRIQSFERFARKYQVSYHVERDKSTVPPKWTVYFKTKQAGDLSAAFSEYSKHTLKRGRKPSVRESMRKFKELVKKAVLDRPKQRERGGPDR